MSTIKENFCIRHGFKWYGEDACNFCVSEGLATFKIADPKATKFCKDCKWMVSNRYGVDEYNQCSCPSVKSNRETLLVTGKVSTLAHCTIQRSAEHDGYCGPNGKFFEQAPPPPPPKPSIWQDIIQTIQSLFTK